MANYYSDDVIREVREANDIVDVIGSYITLNRKGSKNYFGLCPFHNEKTPSFSVNESEQYFHCFGCHESGNVITFVMKMENMNFIEAMQYLADRAHIALPEAKSSPEEMERMKRRARMLSAAKDTARYYYMNLRQNPEGKRALEYLKSRGVTDEYLKKFGLGYAPVSRSGLSRYLAQKGYAEDELIKAGLLFGKEGSTYDRFFNRLMFPIFDSAGNVIAFGGRVMGEGTPKYLNSSDSEIFNKRRNLYGLSISKHTKREFLLLVEGYMDVLSVHQAGFDNAVASLGTALTPEQARLLKRYTDEVVLCYDSDAAGTNAARRGIPILQDAGLRVRVAQVPDGKDPDEFIKIHGAEAYEQVLNSALNPVDFELKILEKQNGDRVEGQIRTVQEIAQKLADIPSDVERELHIRDVAKHVNVSEESLKSTVEEIRRTSGLLEYRSAQTLRRRQADDALKSKPDAASQLMAALMVKTDLYDKVKPYLSAEDFPEEDTFHHTMADYVLGHLEHKQPVSMADLVSCYTDVEDQNKAGRLYELSQAPEESGETFLSFLEDTYETEKFLTQTVKAIKTAHLNELLAKEDERSVLEALKLRKEINELNIKIQ